MYKKYPLHSVGGPPGTRQVLLYRGPQRKVAGADRLHTEIPEVRSRKTVFLPARISQWVWKVPSVPSPCCSQKVSKSSARRLARTCATQHCTTPKQLLSFCREETGEKLRFLEGETTNDRGQM